MAAETPGTVLNLQAPAKRNLPFEMKLVSCRSGCRRSPAASAVDPVGQGGRGLRTKVLPAGRGLVSVAMVV